MARRWGQISHLHATSRMQSMRAHSLWSRVVSADRSSRCSYRPVQLQDRHASLPTPAQTTRMAAPSPKEIPEHHDHSARDGLGSVPSGTQPKPTRTPALHQHTSHHTDTHAQHTHQTHARHDHQIPNQPQKSQTPNQPTTKPKPTTNPNKPTNPQQKPTQTPTKANAPNKTHHHHQNTKISAHGFGSAGKRERKRGERKEKKTGREKGREEERKEKYQHTGSNRGPSAC